MSVTTLDQIGGNIKGFGEEKRIPFIYQDKVVYEWSQTLCEINIFIPLPKINENYAKKTDLAIVIKPRNLYVSFTNGNPYLDEKLWSIIDADESIWYIDEHEIRIELNKVRKGETWKAAFIGHGELNPFTKQAIQKQMMLERFQKEHKGFDFSNATFSGDAPDPRTFLDGPKL